MSPATSATRRPGARIGAADEDVENAADSGVDGFHAYWHPARFESRQETTFVQK